MRDFPQCSKMQIIELKNFNIKTCFIQFLWFFRLKCWFKGQIISRIHLSLPNAYKLMCFDRNINGNRDVKFFEHYYWSLQPTMVHTLAVSPKIRRHFRNKSRSILKLSKNVFYKKCGPKLIFFNEFFFRKIRMFFDIENWLWMSRLHDFRRHCAISALLISKKHFATFHFFVKMKLVSTVWVSTSLSKSG